MSEKELSKHFFNCGIDDYTNEKYAIAKFKFEQAIFLDYMDPKYYKNLAICCSLLNDTIMACEYFKIANRPLALVA